MPVKKKHHLDLTYKVLYISEYKISCRSFMRYGMGRNSEQYSVAVGRNLNSALGDQFQSDCIHVSLFHFCFQPGVKTHHKEIFFPLGTPLKKEIGLGNQFI